MELSGGGSTNMGPNSAEQALFGHVPHDALYRLAVLEQNQRGNTLHAEFHHRLGISIHVELDDPQVVSILVNHGLEDGGDHAARTAPLCPEVNQDGLRCVDDLAL